MMAPDGPCGFKSTTTLDASSLSPGQQVVMADRLDSAIYEVSVDYPTVSHYYVKYAPENAEIAVGLIIDLVHSDRVEDIVRDLVKQSIDAAVEAAPDQRPVVEGTFLVLV